MATENKQTWGARSKKTSVVALGLVAILAGVAVAYFLTSQKFANNKALGGTLSVEATLPIDFSAQTLYPVNSRTDGFADEEFTVTNNNSVDVTYQLFATCEECIPDPADSPEAAAARANKADQFNNLWIRITTAGENCIGEVDLTVNCSPADDVVVPESRLADLSPTNPANLGLIDGEGGEKTFTIELWLKNDPDRAQPQAVENIWEFFVNAKTPA